MRISEAPILIIGIGNPLRGDDGAGHFIADKLAKQNLPFVAVEWVHQPDSTLVEQFPGRKAVLFVDADLNATQVQIQPITEAETGIALHAHQISCSTLALLSQQLGNESTRFYKVGIPVESFDPGASLSSKTLEYCSIAEAMIRNWVYDQV